jgi:hypothetical protein
MALQSVLAGSQRFYHDDSLAGGERCSVPFCRKPSSSGPGHTISQFPVQQSPSAPVQNGVALPVRFVFPHANHPLFYTQKLAKLTLLNYMFLAAEAYSVAWETLVNEEIVTSGRALF